MSLVLVAGLVACVGYAIKLHGDAPADQDVDDQDDEDEYEGADEEGAR